MPITDHSIGNPIHRRTMLVDQRVKIRLRKCQTNLSLLEQTASGPESGRDNHPFCS
tara:strand:- start:310 stop:477 length:168 start_codon:yes stop_codon:yes gene_type:complete